MSDIRNRPDTLMRAALAALQSGLAAQISAINDDLADEGVSWALPVVGADNIVIVAQGVHLPDSPTPRVRIEVGQMPLKQISAGKLGAQTIPINLFAMLTADNLGVDSEGDLVQAASALADACWWSLVVPLRAAPGYDGVERVATQLVLMDLGADDEAIAVEARMAINVGLRRLWSRA